MFPMLQQKVPIEKIPLIGIQKSISLFEKLYPDTDTYHHTIACTLIGRVNIQCVIKSIQILTQRHEVLRSKLIELDNQPYLEPFIEAENAQNKIQNVLNVLNVDLKFIPPIESLLNTLETLNKKGLVTDSFSLSDGPLWRCVLLCYSSDQYQLVIVLHHLITDATSTNIIIKDLSEIYNALSEDQQVQLPPIPSFSRISPPPIGNKLEYWKNILNNMTPISLKTDFISRKNFPFQGDRVYFTLDSNLIQPLLNQTLKQKTSIYQLFRASLHVLLYRYTGQTDICIGITSANRKNYSADIEHVMSCFINSIPLRATIQGSMCFNDFLQKTKALTEEAYKNQLPFDILVNNALESQEKIKAHSSSPFDILVNFNPSIARLTLRGVTATVPIELNLGHSKFNYFGLNIDKLSDDEYRGFIEYNTDLFEKETINRLITHFINILISIAQNPNEKIADISFLTAEEKFLLKKANETAQEPILNGFVHDIFSGIALKVPNNKAVVFHSSLSASESITYSDLHQETDLLCAKLRSRGIGPGIIVGVCLSRSIHLIKTILALWKAGGTFLAIETTDEKLKIDYKLKNARPFIVIVDDTTEYSFLNDPIAININTLNHMQIPDIISPSRALQLEDRAYICYTSGTTGDPKGVEISHKSLKNALEAINDRKNIPIGSKVLCTAIPTFDCFIFEILEAFVKGGEIHFIFDNGRLSPSIIQAIIQQYELNVITLLPHISNYLDFAALPSLRDIIIMGDTPKKETIDQIKKLVKERENTSTPLTIRNEYGPTENTIFSTENPNALDKPHTDIGKPIRNTQIFILDPDGNECPIGISGEIYIAGESLAEGYLYDESLTREKFVEKNYHPAQYKFTDLSPLKRTHEHIKNENEEFDRIQKKYRSNISNSSLFENPYTLFSNLSTVDTNPRIDLGSFTSPISPSFRIRLYKTGDCACRLQDGSINFISRMDGSNQIKIHGVRLEKNIIENILQKDPRIKEVVVLFEKKTETLTGFIVFTDPSQFIDKKEINAILKQSYLSLVARLTRIIPINEMPITVNGKINTTELLQFAMRYTPPQQKNELDEDFNLFQGMLKGLWEEVLHITQFSFHDSFEALGGNSLSLATLEEKINSSNLLTKKINIADDLQPDMTIETLANNLQPFCKKNFEYPSTLTI